MEAMRENRMACEKNDQQHGGFDAAAGKLTRPGDYGVVETHLGLAMEHNQISRGKWGS